MELLHDDIIGVVVSFLPLSVAGLLSLSTKRLSRSFFVWKHLTHLELFESHSSFAREVPNEFDLNRLPRVEQVCIVDFLARVPARKLPHVHTLRLATSCRCLEKSMPELRILVPQLRNFSLHLDNFFVRNLDLDPLLAELDSERIETLILWSQDLKFNTKIESRSWPALTHLAGDNWTGVPDAPNLMSLSVPLALSKIEGYSDKLLRSYPKLTTLDCQQGITANSSFSVALRHVTSADSLETFAFRNFGVSLHDLRFKGLSLAANAFLLGVDLPLSAWSACHRLQTRPSLPQELYFLIKRLLSSKNSDPDIYNRLKPLLQQLIDGQRPNGAKFTIASIIKMIFHLLEIRKTDEIDDWMQDFTAVSNASPQIPLDATVDLFIPLEHEVVEKDIGPFIRASALLASSQPKSALVHVFLARLVPLLASLMDASSVEKHLEALEKIAAHPGFPARAVMDMRHCSDPEKPDYLLLHIISNLESRKGVSWSRLWPLLRLARSEKLRVSSAGRVSVDRALLPDLNEDQMSHRIEFFGLIDDTIASIKPSTFFELIRIDSNFEILWSFMKDWIYYRYSDLLEHSSDKMDAELKKLVPQSFFHTQLISAIFWALQSHEINETELTQFMSQVLKFAMRFLVHFGFLDDPYVRVALFQRLGPLKVYQLAAASIEHLDPAARVLRQNFLNYIAVMTGFSPRFEEGPEAHLIECPEVFYRKIEYLVQFKPNCGFCELWDVLKLVSPDEIREADVAYTRHDSQRSQVLPSALVMFEGESEDETDGEKWNIPSSPLVDLIFAVPPRSKLLSTDSDNIIALKEYLKDSKSVVATRQILEKLIEADVSCSSILGRSLDLFAIRIGISLKSFRKHVSNCVTPNIAEDMTETWISLLQMTPAARLASEKELEAYMECYSYYYTIDRQKLIESIPKVGLPTLLKNRKFLVTWLNVATKTFTRSNYQRHSICKKFKRCLAQEVLLTIIACLDWPSAFEEQPAEATEFLQSLLRYRLPVNGPLAFRSKNYLLESLASPSCHERLIVPLNEEHKLRMLQTLIAHKCWEKPFSQRKFDLLNDVEKAICAPAAWVGVSDINSALSCHVQPYFLPMSGISIEEAFDFWYYPNTDFLDPDKPTTPETEREPLLYNLRRYSYMYEPWEYFRT